MHPINYTILIEIIYYQVLLVSSIGVLLSVIFTLKVGLIFTLGAVLSVAPGWLFGRIFFSTMKSSAKCQDRRFRWRAGSTVVRAGEQMARVNAKTIVNAFYYGEAIKLILTMMLFAIVFQWQGLPPVPLFAGFVIAQLAYWLALIRLKAV